MFRRLHHQRIAVVLAAMDSALLDRLHCYFAGGTAIALRYGEFRESVDIDFLVSDLHCYRELRQLCREAEGVLALFKSDCRHTLSTAEVKADQYGIRTRLKLLDSVIKFEVVLEGRIQLDKPSSDDWIAGVPALCLLDLAATKLLANSDRWADPSVHHRDLIDLAMMKLGQDVLMSAVNKAELAYGKSIRQDLLKAIAKITDQPERLQKAMLAMSMDVPAVTVWSAIDALHRKLR